VEVLNAIVADEFNFFFIMIDFYRGGSSKVFLGGYWSGLPIKKIFQTVTLPSPRRQLFREKKIPD
jgi:hypothetical protein